MINNLETKPNELVYIPLSNMQPFIDDLEIPKMQLSREKNKISVEHYASNLPEVMYDQTINKYLIIGGYTTFYAYHELYNSYLLIPCKVFYQIKEDERFLFTLDWMMKNRVDNWYDRNAIITKLINDFHYTEQTLMTFLNKKSKDIQFYLDPPPHVGKITTQQNKEAIINKISLTPLKEHNKDYLYILILYFDIPITHQQLTFISWIRGNRIKFEECELTLEQEHQLIDRALDLKEDFLNNIRTQIQAMQMLNMESHILS